MPLDYLLEGAYDPNTLLDVVNVQTSCDRCQKSVDGMEYNTAYGYPVRSGFYLRESFWRRFFRRGEQVVCEQCMKEDKRFRRTFLDRFPQKRRRRRRRYG